MTKAQRLEKRIRKIAASKIKVRITTRSRSRTGFSASLISPHTSTTLMRGHTKVEVLREMVRIIKLFPETTFKIETIFWK